jgi:glycosyltransferase involved in cell wall biosynthesis
MADIRQEMQLPRVIHLLSGLEIGGKERAALGFARRGIEAGGDHRLLLYDTPFRTSELDFDPAPVPTQFVLRRPGIDLRFAMRIGRIFTELRTDVVHAHNDAALFYAALATMLQGRVRARLVATFHTWPSHVTLGARLLTRWAASRASATVAVSEELRRRLVDRAWVTRCVTIWNGVDLETFHPDGPTGAWRQRMRLQDGSFLIGHVARFDPIKRHIDLIMAARVLHGRMPNVVFALAGQGPMLEEMRHMAEADPYIRFIPHITDIASFMRSIDLFVLCSRDEAAPLALLEAMACGRACVCTAVGGMPFMLSGGGGHSCGILVPPFQPEKLADALERLLLNPQARQQFARRARSNAMRFSFEREWSAYQRIYEGTGIA